MKRFREKRVEDAKPALVRLGVALAVPLASYLASDLRIQASFDSGDDKQGTDRKSGAAAGGAERGRGLTNELHVLQNEEVLANVMHGTSATPTATKVETTIVEGSSNEILGNVEALLSLIRAAQKQYSVSPLWSNDSMSSRHVEDILPLPQAADQSPFEAHDAGVLVRSPSGDILGNEDDLLPQVIDQPSVQELDNSTVGVTNRPISECSEIVVLVRSPSSNISRNEDDLLLSPVISQPYEQDLDRSGDVVINRPDNESSEIEERLLLPEANQPQLVQEPEIVKPVDSITTKSQSKDAEKEREIAYLGKLVKALLERERIAEIQMLEYCRLKEQETTVRELESRLEKSSTEAKFLGLKIESLQEDNQRLKLQASKSLRTMQELDSERAKVQNLKRRLKSIRVQAREKLAFLEQRISMLLDQEQKRRQEDSETQSKLKKLQELENEAAELKKHNFDLEHENLDLAHKLERAQASISSTLEGPQAKVLEEVKQLREENGKLEKEMEQLQTDRFADVEELVYLRWLNACLRYETKNHTPLPGKTAARDLSSRLSPKSEEKAKQLILDYANESAVDESSLNFLEDPESQYNYHSLQGLCDKYDDALLDIPCVNKDAGSRKQPKFFGKLKKLVTRKSSRAPSSCASNYSVSTCSLDDVSRRYSSDSISSCFSDPQADREGAWNAQSACRSPFNAAHLEDDVTVPRCRSDLGATINLRREAGEDDGAIGRGTRRGSLDHQISTPEKVRLSKFAEVLESARASPEHVRAAYLLHS